MSDKLNRYSVITEKNPREILLLKGSGCVWRRCRFCDYHSDSSIDSHKNYIINAVEINKITGKFGVLEIINSGSFVDLDEKTMSLIHKKVKQFNISQIHFENHWLHKDENTRIREFFSDCVVKIKIGVESFDYLFRESYLDKGINTEITEEIAESFDECCLLQGLPMQTEQSMIADIETGLTHFERVCVNIMQNNTSPIKADSRVIEIFMKKVYPLYKSNDRVDILLNNTDFGVGEK